GTFKVNTWAATLGMTGVILSAAYALWLYRKIVFGTIDKPSLAGIFDMNAREVLVFAPLVILTLLFGFYPRPVLDMSAASVASLIDIHQNGLKPQRAFAEAER